MKNVMRTSHIAFIAGIIMSMKCAAMSVETADYGKTHDGITVHQYTLTNNNGMVVKVLDLGGTITQINVPDKKGETRNVVLELPDVAAYETRPNFSTLVGRFANRISEGGFTIDGKFYPLTPNNPDSNVTLHGGPQGFFGKMWQAAPISGQKHCGVRMTYVSPDGEGGFPGELKTIATFTLDNQNQLTINYQATTSKPTVVNFTHHMFINLNSFGSIGNHSIRINGNQYLPMSEKKLVSGEIASVVGTPFDLRQLTLISDGLSSSDHQIALGLGFDHNYVLSKKRSGELIEAATVVSKDSGISMTISTTEPGIQYYTGNFFNGSVSDVHGRAIQKTFALALEPQHYPDSPHHANFPSTILKPGETFNSTTVYKLKTSH